MTCVQFPEQMARLVLIYFQDQWNKYQPVKSLAEAQVEHVARPKKLKLTVILCTNSFKKRVKLEPQII